MMCKKLILKKYLKFSIEFSHKFCLCPNVWFSKIWSHILSMLTAGGETEHDNKVTMSLLKYFSWKKTTSITKETAVEEVVNMRGGWADPDLFL